MTKQKKAVVQKAKKVVVNKTTKKKPIQKTKKKIIPKSRSLVTVNPQALIKHAIDKNLDIEKMERILAMRKELKDEFARDEYFRNLALFQKEIPIIKKKKIVYEKGGSTKVRYKYAPIEEIIEQVKNVLEKFGFSYTFKTKQNNGDFTTICQSYHELGHKEETEFTIPIGKSGFMSAPQEVASASTFAKRYAFCNAFGIVTESEDNDANITYPADDKKMTEKQKKDLDKKYGYGSKKKSESNIKNTGEEKNITNISDYKEIKPDNSKKNKEILKQAITLLNSKNKEGKWVFSSEEMIKNKRAIDSYIKMDRINEALNAIDVIEAIRDQRVGEKK